jgi:hypothetical protein
MITGLTIPSKYMGAYSAIPVKLGDNEYQEFDKYKYITNIVWDGRTSSGATNVNFEGDVYAQFNFSLDHKFSLGDTVLVDDDLLSIYSGYYNVLKVPTTKSIILNTQLQADVTGDIDIHKVKKYKLTPDLQGESKVDLSSTLKDFVTQDLEDVNDIFAGGSTAFRYNIFVGNESIYNFKFDDNQIVTGAKVGFIDNSLSAITQVPFNVGDEIIIEQDLFNWSYATAFDSGGYLAFSGANIHNFLTGQTIEVYGQPLSYYNATSTVREVPSATSLVTNKLWIQAVATTPGNIFGVPRPEYNTTAVITNITFNSGVILHTNIDFAGSSQPIPGTIKLLSGEKSIAPATNRFFNFDAYSARVNNLDYEYNLDFFKTYTIDNQLSGANISQASTILRAEVASAKTSADHYKVKPSSKSWLLVHCRFNDNGANAGYDWYDANGVKLGSSYLFNASGNQKDCYFPIGLDQVLASTNRTDDMVLTADTLSTIYSAISTYSVYSTRDDKDYNKASREVFYQLDKRCSKYPLYHLMWKDAYGSWITYPFSFITEKRVETDKSDFYKSEGNFNADDTFGYNSYDRGQQDYFSRNINKYVLNSDWVEDYENLLFEDMIKSAAVYMQKPDGVLVGVKIIDKDIQIKNKVNDYIYNYRIEVTEVNNDIRL